MMYCIYITMKSEYLPHHTVVPIQFPHCWYYILILYSKNILDQRIHYQRGSEDQRINVLVFSYNLSENSLNVVNQSKYLGVTIQSDLKWKSHVLNISAKANRILSLLRRTLRSSYLSRHHGTTYHTFQATCTIIA